MPKETRFLNSVWIEISSLETRILTCGLIDNGSEITICNSKLFTNWQTIEKKIFISGITGVRQEIEKFAENVEIIIGSKVLNIKTIYLWDKLGFDMLLGNDFLQQFQFYKQDIYKVQFKTPCNHLLTVNRTHYPFRVLQSERGGSWEKQPISNVRNLNLSIRLMTLEQVSKIISENFGENPIEKWKNGFCKIVLKDPSLVIRTRTISYSIEDREEFDKQIKELLALKLIRSSSSPHRSFAFLVRNHAEIQRGKARMVINYKRLNDNTVFDGYLLPNKDDLINIVKNKQFYSKFDCKSGFWQIKMEEESKPLTAFVCPQGQYEWNVMPFGLCNAPQVYQRRMDNIFKSFKNFIVVYVDDILISSSSLQEHYEHLKIFSKLCKDNGIILSQKKAEIQKEKINFLGFILDSNGIQLQPHISTKIVEFPDELKTRKEIQSFLGCLNYAERFIPKLAEKKLILSRLLRKKNTSGWSDEHTRIVQVLKNDCRNLPPLQLPSEKDNLIVQTDASNECWAGVLKTDIEQICRYCGGTFTDTQKKYHSNEKEMLAIVKACQKMKLFLLPKEFKIWSDNTQVVALVKNKLTNEEFYSRINNWRMILSHFRFEILYIKGSSNFDADYLTRDGSEITKSPDVDEQS